MQLVQGILGMRGNVSLSRIMLIDQVLKKSHDYAKPEVILGGKCSKGNHGREAGTEFGGL